MKKLLTSFAPLIVSGAMAQPTIISVTAPAADVSANSYIVRDEVNGNGSAYLQVVERGSSQTSLAVYKQINRSAGLSVNEVMVTGLSGSKDFYRVIYKDLAGNIVFQTGINEIALNPSVINYLKVETLPAKNIFAGAQSAQATLRAVVKSNGISDTWFEYDQNQALAQTTAFKTKQAGIDTVDITVFGLALNATYYFRANSMNGPLVVTATSVLSFSTNIVSDIDELLMEEFKIYPNPIESCVFVEGEGDLEFFDVNGRKVLERKIASEGGSNRAEIDCAALVSGLYTYRFSRERAGDRVTITGKLVKLK